MVNHTKEEKNMMIINIIDSVFISFQGIKINLILFYEYIQRIPVYIGQDGNDDDHFEFYQITFLDHPLLQNFWSMGKALWQIIKILFVCNGKGFFKQKYFDKIRIDKPFNILYDFISVIWCGTSLSTTRRPGN